jgi:hypothetical protein
MAGAQAVNALFLNCTFLARRVEAPTHPLQNLCVFYLMSYADSTFPTKYLIRHLTKKMESQIDHQYALEDRQSRDLDHRLLLNEQQRRIESHKMLEASHRPVICPYYTLSGHGACWNCQQRNAIVQPPTSTETLLRSLTRPPSQVSRLAQSNLISD